MLWPIPLQSLPHSSQPFSPGPVPAGCNQQLFFQGQQQIPDHYPTIVFLIFCLLHLPPLGRERWFSIFYLRLFVSLPLPHLLIVLITERLSSVLCSSSIVTQVYWPFLRIQQPSLLTLPQGRPFTGQFQSLLDPPFYMEVTAFLKRTLESGCPTNFSNLMTVHKEQ